MPETINIDKELSDEKIYTSLIPQIENLINPNEPILSGLANVTAALFEAFDKISWVGFYLVKEDKLFLGPFQGKVACVEIEIGKGVCGTSAQNQETVIVKDVNKFPGHIACDADSKSEIVVPIVQNEKLVGVLDLDSYEYSSFNETDKKYLEEICKLISSKIRFSNFVLQ